MATDRRNAEGLAGAGAFNLLGAYLVRDRRQLAGTLLLVLVATAADVAGPLLAKWFIDDYLLLGQFAGVPLAGLAMAYIGCQLLAAFLRYRQTLRFSRLALAAVEDIRLRVFDRVLRLPLAFYDRASTGQLVSRITNDTEAIKDLYVQFLSVVLTNTILLVGILVAMGLLSLSLMLVALLLVPAVVGVIFLYQRLSGRAVGRTRQLRSELNGFLSESIAGMSVIQASGAEAAFQARFADLNRDYYRARMGAVKVGAVLLRPAIDLFSILVLVGVLWVFGLESVAGVVEIGVLYAFLNYLGRFTEPLAEITQRFNLYQQAMVAGARVRQLLEEPVQTYPRNQAPIAAGRLEVRDLAYAYRPGTPVLQEISFDLPAGSFLAVVGHTGSGKSTLLSLLLGFYSPMAGEIRVDGRRLQTYGQHALRTGLALVPQEPLVVAGTLRENIDMGRGLSAAVIERAARQAHLHAMIRALPMGYETRLGERGTRLSAGQRQLLVLARALAGSPRLLLLDEATAHLDSETEQIVQRALQDLHGNVSLLVVAHRLSTIRRADQILVMSHGRIAERGDHTQLMARPAGLYRGLYQLQRQERRVEAAARLKT